MQPEAMLGHKIRDALKERGIFCFKIHGSDMMMAGLPDWIACIQGRFVGIEVKMPGKEPTARQEYVHNKIRESGGIVIVAHSVQETLEKLGLADIQESR